MTKMLISITLVSLIVSCQGKKASSKDLLMSKDELSKIMQTCKGASQMKCIREAFLSSNKIPIGDVPVKNITPVPGKKVIKFENFNLYQAEVNATFKPKIYVHTRDKDSFNELASSPQQTTKLALLTGELFLFVPQQPSADWKQSVYNNLLKELANTSDVLEKIVK